MVRYAIEQIGIDLDDFRAYRMVMRYPAIGHSLNFFFTRGHGAAPTDLNTTDP